VWLLGGRIEEECAKAISGQRRQLFAFQIKGPLYCQIVFSEKTAEAGAVRAGGGLYTLWQQSADGVIFYSVERTHCSQHAR
jgi:hypothetical protein